jgi:hypothetical protein
MHITARVTEQLSQGEKGQAVGRDWRQACLSTTTPPLSQGGALIGRGDRCRDKRPDKRTVMRQWRKNMSGLAVCLGPMGRIWVSSTQRTFFITTQRPVSLSLSITIPTLTDIKENPESESKSNCNRLELPCLVKHTVTAGEHVQRMLNLTNPHHRTGASHEDKSADWYLNVLCKGQSKQEMKLIDSALPIWGHSQLH